MKKILFCFIIICFTLIFSELVAYGFAMNISAPSIKEVVKAGGSTSGTVRVINKDTSDMGVRAYIEDWVYRPDGAKSFHAPGTTPRSCAKWIRLFPEKFQVEAWKEIPVQYTINVPEDAKGGYYAVIFFESIPLGEIESKEGMLVRFSGRLGTIVYLETKEGSIYGGSIESLTLSPPQSNKPLEMTLLFKNTGNVFIGAYGILNIMDEKGNMLGKERFGPLNTLPGDTREGKVEWYGELAEGSYCAIVTLDIGAEKPIVAEREFKIFYGGAIDAFSVDVSEGKPAFSVLVKNTGHLNIEIGGRIELLKESGEKVRSLELEKSLIAPGREKELECVLEEILPKGTYTAKAIITIGDKELVKEEIFTIK